MGINISTLFYSVPSGASHKFYNRGTNTSTIDANGNTTLYGGTLRVGNNNSYPHVQLGSTNGYNLGVAKGATACSSSANAGGLVLRSINRLLLQIYNQGRV